MNEAQSTTEDTFHLGIKALIRDEEGKILLLQVNTQKFEDESKEYWDLPGGRVQQGQSVAETLIREVAEETGVTSVNVGKEVGMVLSNIRIPLGNNQSVGLILGVYECLLTDSSQEIVLSDEHVAYEWFEPEDAAEKLRVKYPDDFCDLIANL